MTRSLPAARPAVAAAPASGPRRLLLVSGAMGAGHHSAARAVEERAREVWPGVEVVWTDTLDGMGAGPLFRGVYAGCVRLLPWLYALYFRLLCDVPPFHAAVRAVVARWSAHGLAPVLERERPDLVVATFPEGVAGLGWLRRRGRLPMPAVALVADPAPHPLWLDDALDLHLVSTSAGAERLRRFAPRAAVRVAAAPVVRSFAAPEHPPVHLRPTVLVSFGSLGFGDPVAAAAAALDAGADVVVSTSRRARVRRSLERLAARHPHGRRLTVLDWIADPAAALRDADALVTNAGGATALEAVASGTPLLLFDPIPGHGRANAEVLAAAGLATVCATTADLRRAVGDLGDPTRRAADRVRVGAPADFAVDVAALAALPTPDRRRARAGDRLRAQDALFVHAGTPAMPQQVGARIHVADPDGRADWAEHVAALIRTRAAGIDLLCRRLAPGTAPRWTADPAPDPAVHLRPEVVEVEGAAAADAALTAFLAEPVDPVTTGWRLRLAVDRAAGELIVLAAFHHALGDGLAITDALAALLTDEARAPAAVGTRGAGSSPSGWSGAGTVVRGCAGLALAGPAGASAFTGTTAGPLVLHTLRLDGARVRAVARAHGVGTTPLLLAALADALHAVLAGRADGPGSGRAARPVRVRAMVPMTARTRAEVGSRAPGNRTAAMPVELPVDAMDVRARVAAVAAALTAGNRKGLPAATTAALQALGLLPTPVQARAVRMIYGRRFFHVLASVMPGARRRLHIGGGLLRDIYPALPLAPGVGIAFGALVCGEGIGVGVTVDSAIVPDGGDLAAHLAAALDRLEQA